MSSPKTTGPTGRGVAAVACIVAAAALAYGSTLLNGYAWDDGSVVETNRAIRDWHKFRLIFPKLPLVDWGREYVAVFHEASYRPMVTLSYFIDGLLWNARAAGAHAFNLALHMLNAVLVFLLARRFLGLWTAALAGGLFAVHPILSEAVNQVSFREDLLCTAFVLGAALCFVKPEPQGRVGIGRHVAGGLLLGLALFSKEMALAAAPVLIAYDALFRDKASRGWKRSLLRLSPYLAVWIAFAGLTALGNRVLPGARDAYLEHRFDMVWMGRGTSPKEVDQKRAELGAMLFDLSESSAKLAMVPRIFAHHLWKIALPAWLNNEYGWPLERLPGPLPWLAGALATLAYLALMVLVWRRWRLAGFGLVAFVLLLAPVSGLVQIAYIVADRFVYLPMTVLAIVGAAGLTYGLERREATLKAARVAGIGLLLLCLIFLANGRRPAWQSDKPLWERTVTLNPASAKARVNLGRIYAEEPPVQLDAGIAEYRRAITLDPNLPPAYVNLSSYYMQIGQYQQAVEVLRDCNDRGIFSTLARYNLAACYLQLGKLQPALEHFQAIPRPDENVFWQIGMTYYRMGRLADAEQSLRKALAMKEDFPSAMLYLAIVLSGQGKVNEALQWVDRVQALTGPDDCNVPNARGTVLADARRFAEAEAAFEQAIACNPDLADLYLGLALVQVDLKKYDAALRNAQRALELDPRGPQSQRAHSLVESLKSRVPGQ